jgi:hypothetical protein
MVIGAGRPMPTSMPLSFSSRRACEKATVMQDVMPLQREALLLLLCEVARDATEGNRESISRRNLCAFGA